MATEMLHGNIHAQSDAYKFGWTLGLYDCAFENGPSDAARYASKCVRSDHGDVRDFVEGYCDGRAWRKHDLLVYPTVTVKPLRQTEVAPLLASRTGNEERDGLATERTLHMAAC
jgi:hypothetical protein